MSDDSGDKAVHLDAADTGEVTMSQTTFVPEARAAAPAVNSPVTGVAEEHHADPVAPDVHAHNRATAVMRGRTEY